MTDITITDYAGGAAALRQKDLRQAQYDAGAVVMDQVLVNLHGAEHRARRTLETQVFRRDFFRYYETHVLPGTLEATLAPYLGASKLDLVDFGYRVMVNLTADFAGIDRPDKSPAETEELIAMLRLFGRAATLLHYKGDREQVRAETVEALTEFDTRYIRASVERRLDALARHQRGEIDETDLPRDILMVLLRNETGIPLPDDVRLRELAFFSLAGAHTSIHSLTHAMHEIFTWITDHPEDEPRMVSDVLFLQRAVHESFRLHPSSPIAARRALCPMQLNDSPIASGDAVTVDLEGCNRDRSVFGPDADRFNPRRVLPSGQTPYGLSFGLGMHACLGLNLAAGALPKADADPQTHHLGTITMIARALLDRGVRPDPDDAPHKDATTARDLWGYYPVLLRNRAGAGPRR